jgi:hypothetical protein
MWSSAVFLAQGYAVLHSIIVQLSFFTRGAIRSAFRYPLDHFSHVETLTPTFHVNSTHSFSYIFISDSGVISFVKYTVAGMRFFVYMVKYF